MIRDWGFDTGLREARSVLFAGSSLSSKILSGILMILSCYKLVLMHYLNTSTGVPLFSCSQELLAAVDKERLMKTTNMRSPSSPRSSIPHEDFHSEEVRLVLLFIVPLVSCKSFDSTT